MESALRTPPTHRPEHRANWSAEATPVNMMITGMKIQCVHMSYFSAPKLTEATGKSRQLNVQGVT